MQFKHPELLFALFLLIIPVLIHLFQLRKFQKTPFTNVKFLKEVTLQTRKSSQLKKWLVLISRLLALACIIFAFAQPFIASESALKTDKETVIYLDNSFSMQAKGEKGELLKRATQELFENTNIPEMVSWFTNTSSYSNSKKENFKSEILETEYSANQIPLEQILLKAENLFSKKETSEKNLIWISDFQGQEKFPDALGKNLKISTVQLKPINKNNISIDSIFISSVSSDAIFLTAQLTNYGSELENIPVSLFNEEILVAKTSVDFSSSSTVNATFELNNTSEFKGIVSITDQVLLFDNELYFNINKKNKIKVLSINEADATYLQKIYTQGEFDFVSQLINQLDFNLILQQNTILLNELENIPNSLQTVLISFVDNGGTLVIIPSEKAEINSYNQLFKVLNLGVFSKKVEQEKQITTIHFSHPIYQNVFDSQVTNFQYPKVNSFYPVSGNTIKVLSYQDGNGFLLQHKTSYVFTSSIRTENSNFKNSPLVVPTLYSIAKNSLPLPDLYFNIGEENHFAVAIQLPQDPILKLKNKEVEFIPLQKNTSNKVTITTTDMPSKAGIYSVYDKALEIENVSYNYSRKESDLRYLDATKWLGTENYNSVDSLFEKVAQDDSIHNFWKWFVIFALLFLVIEMFLLKLLK
ncbi:MAG: hypothetical protein CVU03_06770 [Bacteroidetes bacterium HGW-Bacteroidetes-2]|jgi:hypothetical protein|nr:MAG: hypothetical protein CVU03_06770 [Bacteroidetes bacterium HGW-Bacteroidetes-2]